MKMKIKVRDRVYSGNEEPIMIILTDKDKENIANMLPECTKYCEFPDTYYPAEIEAFMEF